MTLLQFTSEDGKMLLISRDDIARVYPRTIEDSPITSCIVSLGGCGIDVQESVEKVYEIVKGS